MLIKTEKKAVKFCPSAILSYRGCLFLKKIKLYVVEEQKQCSGAIGERNTPIYELLGACSIVAMMMITS